MRPFVVAELSANHLGSLKRALQIVEAAAEAGADAIKLQTWLPDTMCVDETYRIDHGPWKGQLLAELYREAWTPWDWHKPIFDHARKLGLEPFSAAFDCESVDFLETLGVKRHKVASFELVDLPLIRYMASKGKPMILSTGMASGQDIASAIHAAISCGRLVTLLACTSAYPAAPADANLGRWRSQLEGGWGLSDHSMGIGVAVAAAALGAAMIEKHLTLARADGGPDAGFSMEPHEFKQMVIECRRAAEAVGDEFHERTEPTTLRRSLWVTKDTKAGEPLVMNQNVRTARPALGLPCDTRLTVAAMDLKAGTPLTAEGMA